jgi:hypothetical protein
MQATMAPAPSAAAAISGAAPPVPEAILRSPLFAGGRGFGLYTGLPDPVTFNALFAEAIELYPSATAQQSWDPDREEIRGGKPRRSLITTTAGAVQDAWYASESLRLTLSDLVGLPVTQAGNRGSYSYYAREGDFLDVHRDVETCDVAVITVLHDNTPATEHSGALVVYPGRIDEPLSAIRSRRQHGAQIVKLAPGQTIVLFGGVTPHCVLPVREGQLRIISVLCFRALIDS